MKKKMVIITLAAIFGISTFFIIPVEAQNGDIVSYGSIEFKKTDADKIAIYAKDFDYLANEIKNLKDEIR